MKAIILMTALVAGAVLAVSPAEAAAKKKGATRAATAKMMPARGLDPLVVRAYDGEILGRDPDPFIRLMMIKEQKPQDASGI